MAFGPLLQRILVLVSASLIQASNVSLDGEVGSFIPSCAIDCFESFIDLNRLSTGCGTRPSLQCLCSHETSSGLTIGEGALECIVSEDSLGACQEAEASTGVIQRAYNMCSGQSGAPPNTHRTLSATPPASASGAAIIIIATQTSTPSSNPTFSSTLLTAPSSEHTPSLTMAPTQTAAPEMGSSEPTPSPTQLPNKSSQPALDTGQILGISCGIAGAFALAFLLIFLARRRRRRDFPDMENKFFPAEEEKRPRSFGQRLSEIFHISPPNLGAQPTKGRPPSAHTSPTAGSNTGHDIIGLAVSCPHSEASKAAVGPENKVARPSRPPQPVLSIPPRNPARPVRPPENNQQPTQHQRPTYHAQPISHPQSAKDPKAKPNLNLTIPTERASRPKSSAPLKSQTDRSSTLTNMTGFADLDTEVHDTRRTWRPPQETPQSANSANIYYVADKSGNWVLNANNNNHRSLAGEIIGPTGLDSHPHTPLARSPPEKAKEGTAAVASAAAAGSSTLAPPKPAYWSTIPDDPGRPRSPSVYSQASVPRPSAQYHASGHTQTTGSAQKGNLGQLNRSDTTVSRDSVTTIASDSSGAYNDGAVDESQSANLSRLSPVVESPSSGNGRSPVTYPKIPGRLDGATMRLVPPPGRPDFMSSPPGQPSPTLGTAFPITGSPSAFPPPLNIKRRQAGKGPVHGSDTRLSPLLHRGPHSDPRTPERQTVPRQPHDAPAYVDAEGSDKSSLLEKRLGRERAAALAFDSDGSNGRATGQPGSGARGVGSPIQFPSSPMWHPRLTPTRRGEELFLNVQ